MSRTTNLRTSPISEVPTSGLLNGGQPYRPVVLVVDDECAIADTLCEILTRSGYSAVPAYDAASALDTALLNPPDVLITDVVLPGMSGIDLALTMRRIFPDCKAVLFSGNTATTSLLESATRAGHNFVLLNKPVHPKEMLAHVSECVRARMSARAN
jgi:DNA-binding response OmpR family regulator